jgi:hypothetical protein
MFAMVDTWASLLLKMYELAIVDGAALGHKK